MFYFYIQFVIHTGVGDFQISSSPKNATVKTGQKLLIQGIFR